jgi:hypothetical protein
VGEWKKKKEKKSKEKKINEGSDSCGKALNIYEM